MIDLLKVYEVGVVLLNLMWFIMMFVLIVEDINDNVFYFIKGKYKGYVVEDVIIFILFDENI